MDTLTLEAPMAATRRKVHDMPDAIELLDQLDRSGLPLAHFCALHGIDGRSLSCWRRNLDKPSRRDVQPLRLLEVVVPRSARPAPTYKLHVGDIAIEVTGSFDDDTLARLLRLAASC